MTKGVFPTDQGRAAPAYGRSHMGWDVKKGQTDASIIRGVASGAMRCALVMDREFPGEQWHLQPQAVVHTNQRLALGKQDASGLCGS